MQRGLQIPSEETVMSSLAREPTAASAPSDAVLARSIAEGDHAAFEALMRRFNRLLYRTARSIVKHDFDAEDVVQNAYLLAYRDMGKFRGEAGLSTWLVRIVINEALTCLRKRTRSAHVLNLADDELDAAVEASYRTTAARPELPEESLARSDLRRLIEEKIDELPLPRRTVFILRALEEMSVQETAAVLGIPEATVRTRFFRARMQLSAALAPQAAGALGEAFSFAGERCDRIVAGVLASIARAPSRPGVSECPEITIKLEPRVAVDDRALDGAAPTV
jgi:RNA polymerase sigma-70 factor (ECF subfamily)